MVSNGGKTFPKKRKKEVASFSVKIAVGYFLHMKKVWMLLAGYLFKMFLQYGQVSSRINVGI